MNQNPIVPEFFQLAYDQYVRLQTEEEKAVFWSEIKTNNVSPDVLARHLKEGLLLLSDQVDILGQKVKAQIPV